MNKLDLKLKNFLDTFLIDNRPEKSYFALLRKLKLDLVLIDFLKKENNRQYQKTRARLFSLMKRNTVLAGEIKILNEKAAEKKIKMIFLKGLFLAAELYQPVEKRYFGDTDILVKKADLKKLMKIFRETGYVDSNSKEPVFLTEEEITDKSKHHLRPLTRHIKDCRLAFEVHKFPFNLPEKYQNYSQATEIFFKNSSKKKLLGNEIYLLKPEIRLLYLFVHFSRHCSFDPYQILTGARKDDSQFYLPPIRDLHDMALFIEKYQKEFNTAFFIEKVRQLQVVNEIILGCKMLSFIYDNKFAQTVLKKLKPLSAGKIYSYENQILQRLITMEVRQLFQKDFIEIAREVVPSYRVKISNSENIEIVQVGQRSSYFKPFKFVVKEAALYPGAEIRAVGDDLPYDEDYQEMKWEKDMIPDFLLGKSYIQISNRSKYEMSGQNKTWLKLRIKKPATVYVNLDGRINPLPEWLRRWQEIEEIVHDPQWRTFKKNFPPGEVNLGPNLAWSQWDCNQYIVIIDLER